jgi:hypothetical protein
MNVAYVMITRGMEEADRKAFDAELSATSASEAVSELDQLRDQMMGRE